ncbi:diguanylate cyclase [Duganella radicis]|uniref:diguanylate cyclase n=1 Tax=Duganella radicis TaxID=551988 RepID=A0A6L6PQ50_9BURK|nr:diguanylate cyclase [Duganella radicis]MTV41246.1 diguanylate cyclase [Duganella radicis]
MLRAAAALTLALLVPAISMGQQVPARYYGQQEGLGNLAVTAMAQSPDGYLWLGTENGLYRHNGTSFQRYAQREGLGEVQVTGVTVDHEGHVWVSNYSNLYLETGGRLRPVLRDDGRKINMWPSQNMSIAPDGTRYLITGQRIYTLTLRDGKTEVRPVYSEERVAQNMALARVSGVLAEAGGALWFGCDGALCHQGADGLTVWGPAQGVPKEDWRAFLRDRGGQLWVRGDRHIIALPAGAQRFVDRTLPGMFRQEPLRPVLAEDRQGRVLSNADDGVIRWSQDHWEHYGAANGLRSAGGVTALQFDADGGLWLGSRGLGLVNWRGYGNWENWTTAQGLPNDVVLSFVHAADGVLYTGTRSGLARLPPGARQFAPVATGLPPLRWSSLALDGDGQIWGATFSGVLARLARDGRARIHAQDLTGVTSLLVDRQQRLWLSTYDGVAVSGTGDGRQPVRAPEGLTQSKGNDATASLSQCQAPDGSLWFLKMNQLLQLDSTGWHSHVAIPDGDAELSVMSCAADGALWLSDTRGRLWRATVGAAGVQFKAVDSPLLAGASIVGLLEDRRGWLWVATDAGVAIWNRAHWRFFNQDDGLVWNDTNGQGFYEATDGSMWIATSNGASHVLHPELLFAPRQLSVRIETARRGAEPLAPDRQWQLPWANAPLELELASLHAQNRGALRFHYRLAGLENDWAVTATPHLRYATLPPGDYQFEYYASNDYSHSRSPVQTHAVSILPPWWRTWPFYLLCAALGALLLALAYRLRVRHLLKRQLHTEQLVRERTRELEQSREQLRQRALRDSLTGAWNRGAILELVEHALAQALAQRQPLLLVLLDLDYFKRINDNYGHAAGDAVLRETVARLSAAVRQSDAVGRYGGEEFLVLLPGLNQANGHGRVEELRHAIRHEPVRIDERQTLAVTGSFGAIAFDPQRPLSMAQLIELADQALYRAKENGRNRIEYAPAAA